MEREKRRKIEQEQSFSEPDYSSFINENVTQELPNVYNFLSILFQSINIIKMF